jgi:hypothetical protein
MAEIGARLREARMHAKIDINEVEVQTKIRAKYLRAIENEEWDRLPGEVYVKSFLRTYGAYLGLDTRQLLDDFKRLYEAPSDHELRPIAPLGRDRERGPHRLRIPSWLAVAGVLVAVVAVLYLVGRQTGSKSTNTGTNHAAKPAHRHPSGHTRTATARPATRVKLQLVATAQIYVCLVNGHGQPLIPGVIYSPGQTIPVKSAGKLLLTLGNGSVHMKVNGTTIPVPNTAPIGYELLPTSHRLLTAAEQPRCA